MQRDIDPELDRVLTDLAGLGGEWPKRAVVLREALRTDPLFAMLASTNRSVVESMQAVAKDVPAAIRDSGQGVRDEVRASNRNVLIVVIVCLVLMAGLVGTSIVISTQGEMRVNEQSSTSAEGSAYADAVPDLASDASSTIFDDPVSDAVERSNLD